MEPITPRQAMHRRPGPLDRAAGVLCHRNLQQSRPASPGWPRASRPACFLRAAPDEIDMNKQKWIVLIAALALMGGAAGLLRHLQANQKLGQPAVMPRPIPRRKHERASWRDRG